jgi:uncharacterized protein
MVDTTTTAELLDDRQRPVGLRRVFLALLFVFAAEVGVIGGYFLLVKLAGFARPGITSIIVLLWAVTIIIGAVMYVVLIRGGRLSLQRLGFVRPTWRLLHVLWQAPLAILASAAIGAGVLRLTTGSATRPTQDDGFLAGLGPAGPAEVVAALVLVVVVTPLWEEALFRGAFYLGFFRLMGPVGAVVGSAALFAAFHIAPLLWAFLFPLALCLGWIRWFHQNLWASTAVHALNNLLTTSALLFALK